MVPCGPDGTGRESTPKPTTTRVRPRALRDNALLRLCRASLDVGQDRRQLDELLRPLPSPAGPIRHADGTDASHLACFDVSMPPPTVRQIYALAAALCERSGEEFPATREVASE